MTGSWSAGWTAWLVAVLAILASSPAPAATSPPADEDAFPVVLGTYSTTLIGSLPARTANIRLAARALDGTVVDPGQELSFNARVGPRSAERGYQRAPVILHEMRDLQVGGGVCQVASTLLDAALLAGLRIAERHRHSYPVDYVPLTQDATVVWDAKDLRLVNCLDQRVRVHLEVLGTTLTAELEGEEPLQGEYELVAEEAAAAQGHQAELYRVFRVEGEEMSRELIHRDVYPPTLTRTRAP